MRKSLLALSALAFTATAPLAHAYQAGDFVIRAGIVSVQPNEDSSHLKHSALGNLGGKAQLDHDEELGLNFLYFVTDHIGVELLGATPFKHEVGVGGLAGATQGLNGKLGQIKQLPPTLSLVYYPLNTQSPVQPYVGVGVNYTHFFDESLSSEAKAKGFQGLDVDDSWGAAAQVGVDFRLTERLHFNTQVRYIDLDTTAKTNYGGGRVKVDVDVKPWVYMAALGYKF